MKTLRDILTYLILNENWNYEYRKPKADPQKQAVGEISRENRLRIANETHQSIMNSIKNDDSIAVVSHAEAPDLDGSVSDAYLMKHHWGGDMEPSLMYVSPSGKTHRVERLDPSPSGFITVWAHGHSGRGIRKPVGHIRATMGHQENMGMVLPKKEHLTKASRNGKKYTMRVEL